MHLSPYIYTLNISIEIYSTYTYIPKNLAARAELRYRTKVDQQRSLHLCDVSGGDGGALHPRIVFAAGRDSEVRGCGGAG